MKKFIYVSTLLFISIFVVACNPKDYEIKFEQENLSITIDEEINFDIITNIQNLNEIKYSFSDNNLVEVLDDKIIAKEVGELIITATWEKDKSVRGSLIVEINDLDRKIYLPYQNISLLTDESLSLDFTLSNLLTTDLGFILSNDYTITINEDWTITSKSPGVVNLTIFYLNNDEVKFEITIDVKQKQEIIFLNDSLSIDLNEELELPLKLVGIKSDELEFIYDKQNIIKIENNKIIPIRAGTVVLTAILRTNLDLSKSITITVNDEAPKYTLNDYEYWLETTTIDPYEIIYNQNQIDEFNQVIFSDYSKTKVLDLFNQPKTITNTKLTSIIQNYSNINQYPIFDSNKKQISQNQKNDILDNRNLQAIKETTNLNYGIIIDFAAVRTYPTNFYANNDIKDQFQETSLNVGEGVIVYHTSADNKWSFIQAQNYNGWVENKNIALCTYEEMDSFLHPDNFLIITADSIKINNVFVRMGQKIPYINTTENNYILSFPTKNNNGNLELKQISLSKDQDVSDGYLDYTFENVLKQGFKMLGIPYSWGDKFIEGRDCSSTQNAIFACFGFKMPRNTSNQNQIPNYSKDVRSSINLNTLKDDYRPGTLIFASGHVLMYIGEDKLGNSYVFHNTSTGLPSCRVQSLASYGIGKIIITLKMYE